MSRFALPGFLLGSLAGCGGMVVFDDGDGRSDGARSDGGGSAVAASAASQTGESATSATGTGGDGSGGEILTGDVLDPAEVYIVGTVLEATCGNDVLAHWTHPDAMVAGFGCYFGTDVSVVRPTDGRFVYYAWDEYTTRDFVCDACPYEYASPYPEDPLDNDPASPLAHCSPEDLGWLDFRLSPAGRRYHICNREQGPWYDEAGVEVLDASDSILHVGFDELALTASGRLLDLRTGASTTVADFPGGRVDTARALPAPDAFLIVVDAAEIPEFGGQQQWRVSLDATATLLGDYPPLPQEVAQIWPVTSKLDSAGVLFQLAIKPEGFDDMIVRREVGALTEIVYDEADEHDLKLHGGGLVTGP